MALIGGCMGSSYQTRTITAQALSVQEFFPTLSQTEDMVKDKRRQAVEPKGKNIWYEGLLLAFSLIFLVLGILPLEKKRTWDVHLSDWSPVRTEAAGGRE
jgi:hypothetical protein